MMKLIKTTNTGLLKFNDLTAVTSVIVAEALGVRHSNLMKSVRKVEKLHKKMCSNRSTSLEPILMNDEHRSSFHPIFKEWEYKDSQNRTQKCKIMNEDGVKALIKVIDTQEAYNYFAFLMDEFNKMRLERNVRSQAKALSLSFTDSLQKVYELLLSEPNPTKQPEKLFFATMNKKMHKAVTDKSMPKGKLTHNSYETSENYTEALLRDNIARGVTLWLSDEKRCCARDMKHHIHNYLKGHRVVDYFVE